MKEEFKSLKIWIEKCPVEAAMRIDELEGKNHQLSTSFNKECYWRDQELFKLREENDKLQEKLNAKIMFVSNGMEEEHYALQEENIEFRKKIAKVTRYIKSPQMEIPVMRRMLKELE